jgi:acetylglutamate kinase
MDREKRLIPEMTVAEVEAGIASGTISGGMIPKVENCLDAIRRGAGAATILDGRQAHACLLELFTEGGNGTIIRA